MNSACRHDSPPIGRRAPLFFPPPANQRSLLPLPLSCSGQWEAGSLGVTDIQTESGAGALVQPEPLPGPEAEAGGEGECGRAGPRGQPGDSGRWWGARLVVKRWRPRAPGCVWRRCPRGSPPAGPALRSPPRPGGQSCPAHACGKRQCVGRAPRLSGPAGWAAAGRSGENGACGSAGLPPWRVRKPGVFSLSSSLSPPFLTVFLLYDFVF